MEGNQKKEESHRSIEREHGIVALERLPNLSFLIDIFPPNANLIEILGPKWSMFSKSQFFVQVWQAAFCQYFVLIINNGIKDVNNNF